MQEPEYSTDWGTSAARAEPSASPATWCIREQCTSPSAPLPRKGAPPSCPPGSLSSTSQPSQRAELEAGRRISPPSHARGSKPRCRSYRAAAGTALPPLGLNSLAAVQHLHSSQIKQEATRASCSRSAHLKAPVLQFVHGGGKKQSSFHLKWPSPCSVTGLSLTVYFQKCTSTSFTWENTSGHQSLGWKGLQKHKLLKVI